MRCAFACLILSAQVWAAEPAAKEPAAQDSAAKEPASAVTAKDADAQLYQEEMYWDALLPARSKEERSQSDPNLVPAMKSIALQIYLQATNLEQIRQYVASQQDNLRYAYLQPDPGPSLDTISDNFSTLSDGLNQIGSNLYYLTTRTRLAASQALPDKDIYQTALLILGQIQQIQLSLNKTYLDVIAARDLVDSNTWANSKFFRQRTSLLVSSTARIQDAVFAVYNSGYDLAMRSR